MMGAVTQEELAGSEASGRGSNEDHNQAASFSLPLLGPSGPCRVESDSFRGRGLYMSLLIITKADRLKLVSLLQTVQF